MASIFKIGIPRNAKCDNLVGFPKSAHIYVAICSYVVKCELLFATCDLLCTYYRVTYFQGYKISRIVQNVKRIFYGKNLRMGKW